MSEKQSLDGDETDYRKGDISRYLSDSESESNEKENEKRVEEKPKRNKRSSNSTGTRKKSGPDKSLGTRPRGQRRPEPSSRWQNLQLFDDEETSSQDRTEFSSFVKPEKSNRTSSRRYTIQSQKRSVVHRPSVEYSESSTESEEEDDRVLDGKVNVADLPTEYWQIQRLMKYLKMGNQTASVIALCGLRDFNLSQEVAQMAIRDINGLTLLVNLLKTKDERCKIGSLKILQPLTASSKYNRLTIINSGAVEILVNLITEDTKQIQGLAAATLANMAKSSRGRNIMRRNRGITKLVSLLDFPEFTYKRQNQDALSTEQHRLDLEVARSAALALWSCSTSVRSRSSIFRAGAVPLLAKLIKQDKDEFLVPVVGLVQECAVEEHYRQAFYKEAIMEDIVRYLKTENEELLVYCANAIFKCAEDSFTRSVVRQYGGLEALVSLLRRVDNTKLLAGVTGGIWKCAISEENVMRFMSLNVLETLVKILQSTDADTALPEQVQVHIVGAVAELCKEAVGRRELLRCHGCKILVDLLKIPNQHLVATAATAVAACAVDPECRRKINDLDGLRLLWTLLKSNKPKVVSSAAWGIYRLLEDTPEACETAREFVGGLELIISHLKSKDEEVVTSTCAAVSNLAMDLDNVAVMSDYGVVGLLSRLTHRTETVLRRHLAEAIARCSRWANNARDFCRDGTVQPMVEYLGTDDVIVKRSAMRALEQLGRTPESCIEMHENGVVKLLVQMVGSEDEALQEAAAGCLLNIRRLAMANERARQEYIQ